MKRNEIQNRLFITLPIEGKSKEISPQMNHCLRCPEKKFRNEISAARTIKTVFADERKLKFWI